MKRVCLIATASGNGKTTVGRALAERLASPSSSWTRSITARTGQTRRVVRREQRWNGNRETLRDQLTPRNSVVFHALREYRRRREVYAAELGHLPLVRLRTQAEVERFLSSASPVT